MQMHLEPVFLSLWELMVVVFCCGFCDGGGHWSGCGSCGSDGGDGGCGGFGGDGGGNSGGGCSAI